jgi:3-deoxy-manno-octulosonate cytidylyltransferase (CMP-KDO synthetase)
MNPIILIPARLASTRLPNKPLADIGGKPMIVRVWERAIASGMGEVVVACDGEAIAEAVRKAGGEAVLTDPDLPSGSDRIYAALTKIDPEKKHDVVMNVQGDMPLLDPTIIISAAELLKTPEADIGTLAAKLAEGELEEPSVVKLVVSHQSPVAGKALSFSRNPRVTSHQPRATYYHHIGIYAYRRHALEKFVSLPPSENEKREKLEQLRAMDNGMRIDVAIVDTVPLGVDTADGLELARQKIKQEK